MIIASSKAFQINGLDIKAVGRSALDGLIALVITVLPMFGGATYIVYNHDITPFVVIGISLLVKLLRKYLTDNSTGLLVTS